MAPGAPRLVPLLHGSMLKAKNPDEADAPGMVVVACSEVGQLVSAPTGTSEN